MISYVQRSGYLQASKQTVKDSACHKYWANEKLSNGQIDSTHFTLSPTSKSDSRSGISPDLERSYDNCFVSNNPKARALYPDHSKILFQSNNTTKKRRQVFLNKIVHIKIYSTLIIMFVNVTFKCLTVSILLYYDSCNFSIDLKKY